MKALVTILFLLGIGYYGTAQYVDRTNFRAGLVGGVVVGNFSEAYSLNLGLDIYHHWGVSKEIDLGLTTGFMNAFGEKRSDSVGGTSTQNEFSNYQIIPIGGSARIYPTSGFKFGADAGYAIGINEGNKGGFYYRPSIGIDLSGGSSELNVSYLAVTEDVTFGTVLLGYLFLF
ncbi:hypothetical protein DZC72_16810 [Maribacter algicola]|uniref:Outer membrane protein beta-barrel domain-containing protein n=1 Tax=Maribacter algicola TaxID=2498892 RepID=A0A426RF92_9FLAO|nr:hypothetical protein [Maribacter algicola]RRQ47645.1 hypothetical protein DZC72_16810 [Maribacter algicola]